MMRSHHVNMVRLHHLTWCERTTRSYSVLLSDSYSAYFCFNNRRVFNA